MINQSFLMVSKVKLIRNIQGSHLESILGVYVHNAPLLRTPAPPGHEQRGGEQVSSKSPKNTGVLRYYFHYEYRGVTLLNPL